MRSIFYQLIRSSKLDYYRQSRFKNRFDIKTVADLSLILFSTCLKDLFHILPFTV